MHWYGGLCLQLLVPDFVAGFRLGRIIKNYQLLKVILNVVSNSSTEQNLVAYGRTENTQTTARLTTTRILTRVLKNLFAVSRSSIKETWYHSDFNKSNWCENSLLADYERNSDKNIVAVPFVTALKGLEKKDWILETSIKTILSTTLSRPARILRRVLVPTSCLGSPVFL